MSKRESKAYCYPRACTDWRSGTLRAASKAKDLIYSESTVITEDPVQMTCKLVSARLHTKSVSARGANYLRKFGYDRRTNRSQLCLSSLVRVPQVPGWTPRLTSAFQAASILVNQNSHAQCSAQHAQCLHLQLRALDSRTANKFHNQASNGTILWVWLNLSQHRCAANCPHMEGPTNPTPAAIRRGTRLWPERRASTRSKRAGLISWRIRRSGSERM